MPSHLSSSQPCSGCSHLQEPGWVGSLSRETLCPLRPSRTAPPTPVLTSEQHPLPPSFSSLNDCRHAGLSFALPLQSPRVPGTQMLHQSQLMTDGFKEHPTGFILKRSENIRFASAGVGMNPQEQRRKSNHRKF